MIQALAFDVFGTVVDWRAGVAREAERALAAKGHALDWGAFADGWRARYLPAMAKVSRGERPFVTLDVLHRENLVELLAERGIAGLTDAEIDELNLAWHRLDPWPDVLEGMARLRRRFILGSLSNGNLRLIVDMARRAGMSWDAILGGDVARAYKPAPEAYDAAARLLGLAPAECLMVAAHPADLAAAAARGLRTAYVHRPLERGPGREAARPAAGTFDYQVDSFIELAQALGA
ncbi:MAG TPA: haloacid dehalogenase type II [Caulobacteraceae bacterium]